MKGPGQRSAARRCRIEGAALAVLVGLGGCTALPRSGPPPAPAWHEQLAQRAALVRFELHGRVAASSHGEGFNASLHWAQDGQDYALRLSGPFGQGTVELSGDERRVVLRSGAGPASTAAEPQALLQREFGWSVPIGGLRYWVRGIPDPAHAIEALHLDAGGRLAALEQSGWHVKVLRWVKAGRYELPEKLFLRSEQAQVRLAVTRWTVF